MINEDSFANIIEPKEPHLACIFLLDTSGSMAGEPIFNLMNAVNSFATRTISSDVVRNRMDLAIIKFDEKAELIQDFIPVAKFTPINLTAYGPTMMGRAVCFAIDKIKERINFYKSIGTPYYQPWIFLLSDGGATDDITEASQRILSETSNNKLKLYFIGVDGYNRDCFDKLYPNSNNKIELADFNFADMFNWISDSMDITMSGGVNEGSRFGKLPHSMKFFSKDDCGDLW